MPHPTIFRPNVAPATLLDALSFRAERDGFETAFTYLKDGEDDAVRLSYAELAARAAGIGEHLRDAGLTGSRALLMFEPGLDFIAAFFGALYADVTPVPVYPPDPLRLTRTIPRLQAISREARAGCVLANTASLGWARPLADDDCRLVNVDECRPIQAADWSPAPIDGRTMALLQYTSGSTSVPRGVMVSHDNLMHNLQSIHERLDRAEGVVGVTWLPPYHDLGLIAGVLLPVFSGRHTVVMSPLAFMQRPYRWLRAITKYRAQTSGSPNFGYELCLRKISPEERASLDLSDWIVACNGAEPIRTSTLREFAAVFGPQGFRAETFYPSYGLAEATLFAAGGERDEVPVMQRFETAALGKNRAVVAAASSEQAAVELVAHGRGLPGQQLKIVDPTTRRFCDEGHVGEIWISGPSVAQGYWNRPEETRETFGANSVDDPVRRYLRTGDLGFLLDNELYVTGRLKDLIIIGGRNVYPQDLELTAVGACEGLKLDGGAAFAVEVSAGRTAATEGVVLVQEVLRPNKIQAAEAIASIRTAIAEVHGVDLEAVVLIKPGSLPKTSSGKVQRRAARDLFAEGRLVEVARWSAFQAAEAAPTDGDADASTNRMCQLWQEVFGVEAVGPDDNFLHVGGNSLLATELLLRINRDHQLQLGFAELVDAPTPRLLARCLAEALPANCEQTSVRDISTVATNPSPGQRALWRLDRLHPQSRQHHLAFQVRSRFEIDADRLRHALDEVMARHDSLRTTFVSTEGELRRIVHASLEPTFEVIDLAELSSEGQVARTEELAEELVSSPFDLDAGPLLRCRLILLGQQSSVVQFVFHHIAIDGWSLQVLANQLAQAYDAPALSVDAAQLNTPEYAEFVLSQEQYLASPRFRSDLAYWVDELRGLPSLRFPLEDRFRAEAIARQSGDSVGRQLHFVIEEDRSHQLRDWAAKRGVTPAAVLFAAWQIVIARYSGQADFAIGTIVAGRTSPEFAELVGFLANTVVIRTSLSEGRTAGEVVTDVARRLNGALAHQNVPFDRVIERLREQGWLAGNDAGVRVLFVSQGFTTALAELARQGLEFSELDNGHVKFDLVLQTTEQRKSIAGRIGYRTAMFDEPTTAAICTAYQTLLAALIDDLDLTWDRLPLRDSILASSVPSTVSVQNTVFAQNTVSVPNTASAPTDEVDDRDWKSIVDLFEESVSRNPARVAVRSVEHDITYRELDERSSYVAAILAQHGVAAESLVAVLTERNTQWLVAVLAIWKAGGVYVPVDAGLPQARRKQLVERCRPDLILTTGDATVADPGETLVMSIQDALAGRTRSSTVVSRSRIRPDQAAYVIFTSGSTGHPKGVVVEHRGLPLLAVTQIHAFGMDESSRVLQFAAPGFDASISELSTTLLSGGTLCMAEPERMASPEHLAEILEQDEISVVTLPPTLLRRLPTARYPSLRTIVSAGEACTSELVQRWAAGRRFLNAYGPSETTVCATMHVCRPSDTGPPPIGRLLPGLRARVTDRHGEDVPCGFPGELCLSGPQLARGYLGEPDETTRIFVINADGERWYRTGDRVVETADGLWNFLGRVDDQIKLHGVRIEPGEIEHALRRDRRVADAAVVPRFVDNEVAGLVAFVVPTPRTSVDTTELRNWLVERIPASFVPQSLQVVDELPRTANGKIDRGRLLKSVENCDAKVRDTGAEMTAPQTPLERRLHEEWIEILGHDRFGVATDFFMAGGDSIRAATLVARLQQWIGEYVYPVALFDAPTIRELADYLRTVYPEAIRRVQPGEPGLAVGGAAEVKTPIEESDLQRFSELVPHRESSVGERRNPPAVFLLSSPRSGSTLLRSMLAGHPALFAPPELELLSFATMGRRDAALAGKYSFWKEGLLRAVMSLRDCDAEAARNIVSEMERDNLPTERVYQMLQSWAAPRTLVDKTPAYALDPVALHEAERIFDRPYYIHLVRHPAAVVRSFVDARLEQVFFRVRHDWSVEQLAELIWLACERNIEEFLREVPAERKLVVRYESLVDDPRDVMLRVCDHFGWEFDERLLTPYDDTTRRMTDGIHPLSKMVGDVRFHTHQSIDSSTAKRWKGAPQATPLSRLTAEHARHHAYDVPVPRPSLPAIERLPETSIDAPPAYPQQRLWFLERLESDNPFYNITTCIRLDGEFDVERFGQALSEIVSRHEPLRTVIRVDDQGAPRQEVRAAEPVMVRTVEIRGDEWRETALSEARTPFDPAEDLLLRCLVIRQSEKRHVVLLTMHHLAADGWSMGVLLQELTEGYDALMDGREPQLPALTVRYRDFAAWQRAPEVDAQLRRQAEYWKAELAGLPDLDFPTDRPRPAAPRFQGDRLSFTLPTKLHRGIVGQARQAGTTPFTVVLATFELLLSRWSGQHDFGLGMGIAGRHDAALQNLIGFFANTLVIRSDVSDSGTFRDLLSAVKARVLRAFANQDVPFEWLVEQLQPERRRNRSPLFQTAIVFQNMPLGKQVANGLTMTRIDLGNRTAKYDLTLYVWPDEAGWLCTLEYDTDLFDRETIERLRDGWLRLLDAIVRDPDTAVTKLPVISEAESRQLIERFSRGPAVATPQSVLKVFAHTARTQPQGDALADSHGSLTYGELDAQSDRIAAAIRRRGLGRESVIAVALPRGCRNWTASLAILKAGAAFLPLDTSDGTERLRSIIVDSECDLIVSEDEWRSTSTVDQRKCVTVEELLESVPADATVETIDVPAESLAYVMHTSGSTGRPKGVMIEHRGLANLVAAQQRMFGIQPGERVLQFASPAFDAAVWEAWLAWGRGGTLVVADEQSRAGGVALATFLRDERIAIATLTPSVLDSMPDHEVPELKTLISAGETLRRETAERWSSGRRLVNAYGPTETTVCATWGEYDPSHARSPSIGRAIPGFAAYVIDKQGRVVPRGTPGELWISGAGLARGYRGNPGETAARFAVGPVIDGGAERIYRTGDLVRWSSDGRLEFLGRLDRQIKRHGIRIEPAEIEAALMEQRDVAQAAVREFIDEGGHTSLVAYVVAEGAEPNQADRRRQARVEHWRSLYEATYGSLEQTGDPRFQIVGWQRSDDGRPFAAEEMRDWVGETVTRILQSRPKHVLEVGCGTGLLAFSLIEHVDHYTGADMSPAAVAHLRAQLTSEEQRKTHLAVASAEEIGPDQIDTVPDVPCRYDMVVFNSVVQYFPDEEYLRRALDQAWDRLSPIGEIFIGDVRALVQHRAFHTWVVDKLSDDATTMAELRRRIDDRVRREPELLVDSRWFQRWAKAKGESVNVTVQLKQGAFDNELTKFRYDVVISRKPCRATNLRTLSWPKDCDTLDDLIAELERSPEWEVVCEEIPDARVLQEWRLLRAIEAGDATDTREMVRKRIASVSDQAAVHPRCLFAVAEGLGRSVALNWSDADPSVMTARFAAKSDVVADRIADDDRADAPRRSEATPTETAMVNTPYVVPKSDEDFMTKVQAELRNRLPTAWQPSRYIAIDRIPLTRNGKVDWNAMPEPGRTEHPRSGERVAPADDLERELAGMWEAELRVSPIGVTENFFDLGGHSLMAVRLMDRIQQRFPGRLPLAMLFEKPTVRQLAKLLREQENPGSQGLLVPLQRAGSEAPLFLIHPAGGTVFCYMELARCLGATRPIYGLQAKGLSPGDSPHKSVAEMLPCYLEEIRRVQPHGPYQLAGWSLGGNLAYLLAHAFRQAGEEVALLAVIDSGVYVPVEEPDEAVVAEALTRMFPDEGADVWRQMREMKRTEQEEWFRGHGERSGILLPSQNVQLIKQAYRVFRYNVKALSEHESPVYDGPVTLCVSGEQGAEAKQQMIDAWEHLVPARVAVHQVAAKHLDLLKPPRVRDVAAVLQQAMQERIVAAET